MRSKLWLGIGEKLSPFRKYKKYWNKWFYIKKSTKYFFLRLPESLEMVLQKYNSLNMRWFKTLECCLPNCCSPNIIDFVLKSIFCWSINISFGPFKTFHSYSQKKRKISLKKNKIGPAPSQSFQRRYSKRCPTSISYRVTSVLHPYRFAPTGWNIFSSICGGL